VALPQSVRSSNVQSNCSRECLPLPTSRRGDDVMSPRLSTGSCITVTCTSSTARSYRLKRPPRPRADNES
jgi:hypothetical protein